MNLERESADRLRALHQITDAALAYLSLDELLLALMDRIGALLSSDTVAFLLLDEPAGMLVARAAKGIEEEVKIGVRIPLGRGFAGRIAAERRAIAVEDVDHADILNPILRERGIRSLLGVPLIVEGRVVGVLHVGTLTERHFTVTDSDLLQLAADRAALAIEHARLGEQRGAVEALQRTLLPEPLRDLLGIDVAGRYLPASVGGVVGGDWFDMFELGGGRLALVIGDVMGRGVEAAALMAQLRTAVRAYALEGLGPADVVARINRLSGSLLGPPRMTTLAYVVLDPETESVTAVSAGHLPPLTVAPDGRATFLDVGGAPPVGVSAAARFDERAFAFPTGSKLVLVTDGAVEVRGEALDRGLERLRALAVRTPDPEDLAVAIARGEAAPAPFTDDLAVLVVRLAPLPDRLATSWPADPRTLSVMRHLLRRWLTRLGAAADETYDITVAVQEASANAVEHAYAPGPAAYEVEASHEDRVVTIVVRDRGRWRAPRGGAVRGRGLPMIQALMESVQVDHGEEGTTVVMRRTLAA